MTLLIATVAAPSPEQARADLAAALSQGADALEFRADLMADCGDDVLRAVAASRPAGTPLVLTFRSAAEGGAWDGDESERMSRLIALGPIADYLDVEWSAWERSANVRQKAGLARREGRGQGAAKLILSLHDPRGRPARLTSQVQRLWDERRADAVKIAWRARSVRDNFEAFEILRAAPKPTTVLCLGEDGLMSRVLARKFGAFASYAAAADDRPGAPGQLTVETMRRLYRWDRIDAATRVYGLIGDPVAHSLSPAVHNAMFERAGIDAIDLPLRVRPGYESLKAFLVEVLDRRWMDFGGFSVTRPHKEHALRFVSESGGRIDDASRRIGAVNTLTVSSDGSIAATNTDAPAALSVVSRLLGCAAAGLSGRSCLVLGAGGAARAVVFALSQAGATVHVWNRTPQRAESLAAEFGCRPVTQPADGVRGVEVVVNCTPAGMRPATDESPLPVESLPEGAAVLDLVYDPPKTRLLRDAADRGCRTMGGLTMFADQAAAQFEAWTGRRPPFEWVRSVAESELAARGIDR